MLKKYYNFLLVFAIIGIVVFPATLFMIYFNFKEKLFQHIKLDAADYFMILFGFTVDMLKILLIMYLWN